MRLACVTPLETRTTGVAEYSLDLLPHLARLAHHPISVFSGSDESRAPSGDGLLQFHPISELPALAPDFDLIFYQMGNSPAHDFMAPYLFEHPGLATLHDLSLHEFYARQARAGLPGPYRRAFGFAYGMAGTRIAREQAHQPRFIGYPDFLLSEWLAARSPGVIVHSRHAAEVLGERCPAARTWIVPMPMPAPDMISRNEARRRLGLSVETYLVIVFGVLNLSKNPLAVLDALARLRADRVPAQVAFIGPENSEFRLRPEAEQRGVQPYVCQPGFVDEFQVRLWLSAGDVAVGLRSLYWGETPSSALRVMASGLPIVVNPVGAFAELPDAACIKLSRDEPDVASAAYAVLLDLYRRPDRLRSMGDAARAYVVREHDPAASAAAYLKAVASIVGFE